MALQAVLRPLLTFSSLWGLGPYGEWHGGRLQHRRAFYFYSVVLFSVLFGLQLLIFMDFSGTAALATSTVADLIDTYGFAVTCLGSFVTHNLLGAEMRILYNRVLDLHQRVPCSRTHILLDIICGLIYEAVFVAMSIWGSPFQYSSFFFYIVETMTYTALEVSSFVIFLQFTHLVLACWRSFRALNAKIRKLLVQVSLHPSRNKAGFQLLLRKLLEEHAEIVAACRSINRLFALQNLLSVVLIFFELTYASYNAVNSAEVTSSLTDTLLWAGYFLYKLLATLTVCSLATSESQETAILLQNFTYAAHVDPVLISEVECCFLQLVHDNVAFDAFGFFPLDFSLIYSISGSVTGYLIILVQFNNVEDFVIPLRNLTEHK